MSVFVHAQGMKTVHAGGGGSKNGKILSTQLLHDPLCNFLVDGKQFPYLNSFHSFMYCDQYIRPNSKKNTFCGNYSRKYSIYFTLKKLKKKPQKLLRKTQIHFFSLLPRAALNGQNRRVHVPNCGFQTNCIIYNQALTYLFN